MHNNRKELAIQEDETRTVEVTVPPPCKDEDEDFKSYLDPETNVKVVKETPSANGAELQVEGVSAESKGKATGVITLVKEGGAWKIAKESWGA